MAQSSDLTGAVAEDAVPLTSLTPEHVHFTPGSRSSYQPRLSGPGSLEPSQALPAGARDSRQGFVPPSHTSGAPTRSCPVPQGGSPAVIPRDSAGVASPHDSGHSTLESDVMKGVSQALGGVVLDNVCPPLSACPTSSLEKTTQLDIEDREIEEYKHKFPKELKMDYYDAVILYQEDEKKIVKKFWKRVISEVKLMKVEQPKVGLFDEILPGSNMTNVGQLDFMLPYCTYVFLYVTKEFCKDGWTEVSSQTCLMNAIDSVESRWSVVPIFTEPKRKPTFRIPPSIRSLKGIQYWSDDKFYVDSIRKLLEDKLHVRKEKEAEQKCKRKRWIMEEKGRERRAAAESRQKDLQIQERERIKDQQHFGLLKANQDCHQQNLEQLRIQIQEPKEFFNNYQYERSSQNDGTQQYFQRVFEHHSQETKSAPSSLKEQGFSEAPYLQHSFSDPYSGFGSLPTNPSTSYFEKSSDLNAPEVSNRPTFYLDPQGSQNNPRLPPAAGVPGENMSTSLGHSSMVSPQHPHTFCRAPPSSGPPPFMTGFPPHPPAGVSSAQPGFVGSSWPLRQQPNSVGGNCGPGHPHVHQQDFWSLPNQMSEKGTWQFQGHQKSSGTQSLKPAAGEVQGSKDFSIVRDVEQAVSAVTGEVQNVASVAREETVGSGSHRAGEHGEEQAASGRGQADGKEISLVHQKGQQTNKNTDDLTEDHPPASHPYGAGYPVHPNFGKPGQPNFSETVVEPPLVGHGPGYVRQARAGVQPMPDERDHLYNPPMQYSAAGRLAGSAGLPPFPSPPPPYPGHNQYTQNPQYSPQQAYLPGHIAQRYPWHPAAAPVGYQPYYYNQHLPPHLQQQQLYHSQEPSYVYQYHIYHQQPVERVPTTTINYISRADNVMMANTITTKNRKSRMPEEENMASACGAGTEDRQAFSPSLGPQQPGSENMADRVSAEAAQPSIPSSSSTVGAMRGSHATQGSSCSQLTASVTGNHGSHQSSAPPCRGGQTHLTELRSDFHESRETSSVGESLGSMGPAAGQWSMGQQEQQRQTVPWRPNDDQPRSDQWPETLQQEQQSYDHRQETVSKAFVTGSDDEGGGA